MTAGRDAGGQAGAWTARDRVIVAWQLGRPPRDVTGVAARCIHGYPAVIETAPILSDGSPNPTLLYLTCPSLVSAISRSEAAGGVRLFKKRCDEEERFRNVVQAVTELYRERRQTLAGDRAERARLEAGIGGPSLITRATCLHAHAAAFLAVLSGWLGDAAGGTELEAGELVDEVRWIWDDVYGPGDPWCSDARCGRHGTGVTRAVVDVGTISVRLLVARVSEGRVDDVVRRAQVTRLGEGLWPDGRLSQEARARTAEVVRRFIAEARGLGAESILMVGTSATRDATDGRTFLEALGASEGVEAEVLTGEEEAAATYAGVCVDVKDDPVVLDIGGGSTELVRRNRDGALDVVSLDLGASRALESWLKSDPPSVWELARVKEEVEQVVHGVRTRFGWGAGGSALVGVAGTVTTLACLDAGLQRYSRAAIHLRALELGSVRRWLARLAAMSAAQRAGLPCVQPGRAPVIVGGAAVLAAVMETLGYERLIVSERDLLDGLIMRGSC